ncbi:MAG: DNA repair protein RadC [Chloroflexota bacterium]
MKQSAVFTVRDMPSSERPRERLLRHGPEALSIQELIALVLGRGGPQKPVMNLAQELLSRFGSLRGIASASADELQGVTGVKLAKAAQLKAVFELGRRLEEEMGQSMSQPVRSPEDVVRLVKPRVKGKKKEHFWVVFLDTRNRITGIEEVSMGSLDTSLAHPREVFKPAIDARAASVVLVHNHPSGDPEPSEEDIKLTRRMVQAAEVIGIGVTDHIIVCDSGYVSLKGRNLVP